MKRVELVIFNGVKFRRYPDARAFATRNYFMPGIADRKLGIDMLHREMWKFYKGPIPPGYHIHHKDEDALHNSIDNFACLSPDEHSALHPKKTWRHKGIENQRKHMHTMQMSAKEWHASAEGRKWHSEHRSRLWREQNPHQTIVCKQCGREKTLRGKQPTIYCSNACSAKARRLSGIDDVTRPCGFCQQPFTTNRFRQQVFCSKACMKRDYWKKRKAA